ncbi:hypothetical protein HispidOSU_003920, partial [Sigmodon hispidus]
SLEYEAYGNTYAQSGGQRQSILAAKAPSSDSPNDNGSWFIVQSQSEAQDSRASRAAHGQPFITSEHPDILPVLGGVSPQCSSPFLESDCVKTKCEAFPHPSAATSD